MCRHTFSAKTMSLVMSLLNTKIRVKCLHEVANRDWYSFFFLLLLFILFVFVCLFVFWPDNNTHTAKTGTRQVQVWNIEENRKSQNSFDSLKFFFFFFLKWGKKKRICVHGRSFFLPCLGRLCVNITMIDFLDMNNMKIKCFSYSVGWWIIMFEIIL